MCKIEKALAALRLRARVMAAEQALTAYRENHRSSMMARASDAFRTISLGAYRGLAVQAAKDAEVLMSKLPRHVEGNAVPALYLALRVAGHQEFRRTRRPVPFVADDIMETFDDFRATVSSEGCTKSEPQQTSTPIDIWVLFLEADRVLSLLGGSGARRHPARRLPAAHHRSPDTGPRSGRSHRADFA